MDIDIESLYKTVDQLDPQQRENLMIYLTSGQRHDVQHNQTPSEWQFDLARGAIQTTSDFDAPLPDEFWRMETS